jgi:hypothetical protein
MPGGALSTLYFPQRGVATAVAANLPDSGRIGEMSQNDAFALKNSGLNEFLFAELGTDLNGGRLTVLSTLARLGKDPWAQAAEWARMPIADTIDGLTQSILRMPLCADSLAEARATAGRLVVLLPRKTGTIGPSPSRPLTGAKIPQWLLVAGFSVVLIVSVIAASLMSVPWTHPPVMQISGQVQ